jgi:endoglycosylceramidase
MQRSCFAWPLILAAALPACSGKPSATKPPAPYVPPCKEAGFSGDPLGTRCTNLVDAEGRVVFLRGVNARIKPIFDVVYDPSQPPLMPLTTFDASDATGLRSFGFDALRLPLNWSGIEPTMDGGFDESYLAEVANVVAACKAAGVRVLLDLHQDAYSKELGGDGAPLWAIQPPPTMIGPPPMGTNPATSGQAIAAFNTFFGTSMESEMLRSRFIAMATHVAARFATDPTVIGLEIFNEPPVDISILLPFYQAALPAVRAVMPKKLFMFEPNAFRNIVDTAPPGSGSLGAGTVYAPHVYTFVFNSSDAAEQAAMTKEDLRPSEMGAATEGVSWDAPAVVTEWGYDPSGVKAEEFFTWQAVLQEEYQLSSFLWLWKELAPSYWGCFDYDATTGAFTERPTMKKVLARVRPAAVAGWPTSYSFDRASGAFELQFQSDPAVMAPHLIAVAPVLGAPTSVTCDGAPIRTQSEDAYGTLSLVCGQGDGESHTVKISVAALP